MRDISNFYNLTEAEQNKEKKNLWKNSFPNISSFAKNLKETILQKDCPKVITLEGGYGMGKTYFSSRFCEYLKSTPNTLTSVYFSAWEDDNLPDPFLSFSKAILSIFPKKEKLVKEWGKCLKMVVDNIDINPTIRCFPISFNLGHMIDIFIKKDNPLASFRKKFSDLISKLPNKKMVLIVDELDRCRPDYAIKVLETIKHFFDVEGIIVILPVNLNTLISCVETVYSLDGKKSEIYLKKFIDYRCNIPDPNYQQFIENGINEQIFSNEIKKGYLNVPNKDYCSFKTLQEDLLRYTKIVKPSLRELSKLLNIIELAIRGKKERIRSSLLVHLLFKKFIRDNQNHTNLIESNLPIEKNFKEILNDKFRGLLKKYEDYVDNSLRTFRENRGRLGFQISEENCQNFIKNFKQMKSYGEIATLLKENNKLLEDIYGCTWSGHDNFISLCNELKNIIDLSVNKYGIFEISDELHTKPKIQEYKDFVNHLKL